MPRAVIPVFKSRRIAHDLNEYVTARFGDAIEPPVEELRSQEGINVVMVEPYQDETIPVKVPAVVLIVTD